MVKQNIEDRRVGIRAKRVLSIQFRLVKSKRKILDKNWYLSTTYDMSVGGIAFYTNQEYQPGDILEVRVTMSGILDVLKGLVKVRRVERKKMGAFFLVAVQMLDKDLKEKEKKIKQTLVSFKRHQRF